MISVTAMWVATDAQTSRRRSWINLRPTYEDYYADEAISSIKAKSEKPFFIYLPFQAPHSPYQDPNVPLDPPGKKERKTLIKRIERLDREIGRVLKTLDDQKLAENTLVIMTSDNGGAQGTARNLPLNGAKQMLLEGGTGHGSAALLSPPHGHRVEEPECNPRFVREIGNTYGPTTSATTASSPLRSTTLPMTSRSIG